MGSPPLAGGHGPRPVSRRRLACSLRRAVGARLIRLATLAVALVALTACLGGDGEPPSPRVAEVLTQGEFEHVHGLGVNPGNGAIFVATHSGVLRLAADETSPRPIDGQRHDLEGFMVLSEDVLVASGHPDPSHKAPGLGLIISSDAGRTWRTASLAAQADLHVIRIGRRYTYAFDALSEALFVSADLARSWAVGHPPAPLFDLAIDPERDRRLLGATDEGLFVSSDRGARWRRIRRTTGYLAWSPTDARRLYMAERNGRVSTSEDGGRSWEPTGRVQGTPTAAAIHEETLYLAVDDEAIWRSVDGGRQWSLRARLAT